MLAEISDAAFDTSLLGLRDILDRALQLIDGGVEILPYLLVLVDVFIGDAIGQVALRHALEAGAQAGHDPLHLCARPPHATVSLRPRSSSAARRCVSALRLGFLQREAHCP